MKETSVDFRLLTSHPLNPSNCPNVCADDSSACRFKPRCAATLEPIAIDVNKVFREILRESSIASNAMISS